MTGPVLDIALQLRGPLAETLLTHAERLGEAPAELLADIVEMLLTDDLVGAILDR